MGGGGGGGGGGVANSYGPLKPDILKAKCVINSSSVLNETFHVQYGGQQFSVCMHELR